MLMIFLDLLQSLLMVIEFKFDFINIKYLKQCFETIPDVNLLIISYIINIVT